MDLVDVLTQYIYEKKWSKTSEHEAFNIIEKEMPETDVEATWEYILSEIKKGKTITLGDCRFKLDTEAEK
jgi:hypothetical protein